MVDQQNAGDAAYHPLAPNFDDSIAFLAAQELILSGGQQPNGYTEPILQRRRRDKAGRPMRAELGPRADRRRFAARQVLIRRKDSVRRHG